MDMRSTGVHFMILPLYMISGKLLRIVNLVPQSCSPCGRLGVHQDHSPGYHPLAMKLQTMDGYWTPPRGDFYGCPIIGGHIGSTGHGMDSFLGSHIKICLRLSFLIFPFDLQTVLSSSVKYLPFTFYLYLVQLYTIKSALIPVVSE